jgi:hypothetical protein
MLGLQGPDLRALSRVELLGALLAIYAIYRFGLTARGIAACGLLWTLLALTCIDFDTQLLPDNLTLPLVWAGLLVNLNGWFVPLSTAVIGAIAGYLSLWTVYWAFKLIRGKEGMGYGDFKLFAALGAWARLADAHRDPGARLDRRRGHRHFADRVQRTRSQCADGLRSLPRDRRCARAVLGTDARQAVLSLLITWRW